MCACLTCVYCVPLSMCMLEKVELQYFLTSYICPPPPTEIISPSHSLSSFSSFPLTHRTPSPPSTNSPNSAQICEIPRLWPALGYASRTLCPHLSSSKFHPRAHPRVSETVMHSKYMHSLLHTHINTLNTHSYILLFTHAHARTHRSWSQFESSHGFLHDAPRVLHHQQRITTSFLVIISDHFRVFGQESAPRRGRYF